MTAIKGEPQHHSLAPITDPTLHKRCAPVIDITTSEMQSLITDMLHTMHIERGCGLAAPQIGIDLQLAVIEAEGSRFVIANPEITKTSRERIFFSEGCLSIPGKEFGLIRHEKITVRYTDENGTIRKIKLGGFLAIVFQHEIDHLYGTLVADRYSDQEQARTDFNLS